MNPRLPLELQLIVLQHLVNDSSIPQMTLRNCAQSSSAWLQVIRPVLFRQITLQYLVEVQRLQAIFAVTPHLTSFVKSVAVQTLTSRRKIVQTATPVPASLYFPHPAMHNESVQPLVDLLSSLPSIVKLSISRCVMYGHTLHAVISAAKSLEDLELHECNPIHPAYSYVTSNVADTSSFRRIAAIDRSSQHLINGNLIHFSLAGFLVHWSLASNARTLVLQSPREDAPNNMHIADCMRASANTLVELELRFCFKSNNRRFEGYGVPTAELLARAMSSLPHLKTLTLVDLNDLADLWCPILDIFKMISPLPIHRLRIDLPHIAREDLVEEARYQHQDLSTAVEGALRQEAHASLADSFRREPDILPALREMVFVYYGEKEPEWRELMSSTYWFFHERGILSLVVGDPEHREV